MEPDSTFLVILLIVFAVGALYMMIRFGHVAIKIASGTLALALALVSGVALVNVYYGYYQTWSQLKADLTGSYSGFTSPHAHGHDKASAGHGEMVETTLSGPHSGISRMAYVYLPPQYFDHAYAHVRFPVVELLHGSPGSPVNWMLQINVQSIMDQLIDRDLVGPMIVVMPSIDAGNRFQECVDAPGALDDTYISEDVPADIRAHYRASLVPAEWGIGGFSSGGYCAANLSLRHRADYGAVGILDGYFRPGDGPAANALHNDPRLEAENDPLTAVQGLGRGADPLPSFWVSAGTADARYRVGAQEFVKALANIQAITFTSEPGAGHNFYAWRPAIPRMLGWMWQQIAPPALRIHFPIAGPVNNSVLVAPKAPGSPPRHPSRSHASTPSP
ncbi:MAG: hypothetical protein J0H43_08750 [Actinobacteria bacterium]|nr:hypothetical protein [Actinomycetota bacterium]